jgi:hypothetical protein
MTRAETRRRRDFPDEPITDNLVTPDFLKRENEMPSKVLPINDSPRLRLLQYVEEEQEDHPEYVPHRWSHLT